MSPVSNTFYSLNIYPTSFQYLLDPPNMFDDIFQLKYVFETGAQVKLEAKLK